MLAAMAAAEVGDEQEQEDPTVNELQRRAAELLGHERALFLPTATMANQIALRVLTRPGGQLIAEERTHILIFEAGGPAVHSGLMARPLTGDAGRITPEQIRAAGGHRRLAPARGHRRPRADPPQRRRSRVAARRARRVDRRRARARPGRPPGRGPAAERLGRRGRPGRRVRPARRHGQICFSKGLGCAMGAILAGSEERMEEAWRLKFLFGGALRQAGVVAAAMLYALDHNVERLAEDHARAKRLAVGTRRRRPPGRRRRRPRRTSSAIDVASTGVDAGEAQAADRGAGRARRRAAPGRPARRHAPRESPTTTSTRRSSSSRGASVSLQPPEQLREILRAGQARHRLPSVSAAVYRGGEVVWTEAVGIAEDGRPARRRPTRSTGSARSSKTFTAAAVMLLREEGKLDTRRPARPARPGGARYGDLTLRRLLAHSSGLQREPPGEVWETLEFPKGDELLARLARRRARAPARRALALLEPRVRAARRGRRPGHGRAVRSSSSTSA